MTTRIKDIKKIGHATYLINELIKLHIEEDLNCTAEYDENLLTEDCVNGIIDEFFERAVKERLKKLNKL